MIKNEYLQNYLTDRKNISEFDKEMYAHDENRLINLQRPLSQRGIIKLPNKIFKKFMVDIINNKEVNELLYSGNAKKELSFNDKQAKFVAKSTRFSYKRNSFSSTARNSQNLFFKKKKAEMYEIIKKNILESKKRKAEKKIKLEKKNRFFELKNERENKKQEELLFKRENEIKIEGYKRAVEKCLDKSCSNSNFKIPDISLNINNVFSRLYKNAILDPVNITTRKNEIKKTETTNINNITYRKICKIKINSNLKDYLQKSENKKYFKRYYSFNNIGGKNRFEKYKVKKILEGYDGKEFARKNNFNDVAKCIKQISGGPKSKRKLYNKIIRRTILEKKLNFIEKKFDVNSYRDKDQNSFLNIAVERDNEKFVKYFLNKNYNPNEQNKEGNTAMHLSMKNKNRKIIKLLLDKNGDITIKNKEGMTSYDLADKDIRKEFKMENILVLKKPGKYYY